MITPLKSGEHSVWNTRKTASPFTTHCFCYSRDCLYIYLPAL